MKRKHQEKIESLKNSRNNTVARFGRYWPHLREEVDKLYKAGRFHKKPYGPLGQHITVKDMAYSIPAEKALGKLSRRG